MAGVTAGDSGHVAAHNNRGIDVTLPDYKADPSKSASFNGDAIRAALADAASDVGRVFIPYGAFPFSGELTIEDVGVELVGAAMGSPTAGTRLVASGTGARVVLANQSCALSDVFIDGNSEASSGLVLANAARATVSRVRVDDCTSHGVLFDHDAADSNNMILMSQVRSYGNGGCGFAVPTRQSDNNGIVMLGCISSQNTSHGLWIKGNGWSVQSGNYFANGGYGVQIGEAGDVGASTGNVLMTPWIESNDSGGIGTFGSAVRNLFLLPTGQTWDTDNSTATGNVEIVVQSPNKGTFDVRGHIALDGQLIHTGAAAGFYDTTPVSRPDVTGSTDTEKIASILSALSTLGLVTDSTT